MKHLSQITAAAVAIALSTGFSAAGQTQDYGQRPDYSQGPGSGEKRPEMKPRPEPKEIATQMADQMKQEIAITDKQYKKVLKHFESEIKSEREIMDEGRPKGMPDGGGMPPMGGGPGGGGMQGGGGMPPMGGGPGGGGGMPPMMGGGEGMPGGGPVDMEERYDQLEALYDKNEKKLAKILTPEQYSQWRSKHPRKRIELPDFPNMPEDPNSDGRR